MDTAPHYFVSNSNKPRNANRSRGAAPFAPLTAAIYNQTSAPACSNAPFSAMPKSTAVTSERLTRKRFIDRKLRAAGWRIAAFSDRAARNHPPRLNFETRGCYRGSTGTGTNACRPPHPSHPRQGVPRRTRPHRSRARPPGRPRLEPASALLERIRAAKQAELARRNRKAKAASGGKR